MNKYSSFYLSEVFEGIQKNALSGAAAPLVMRNLNTAADNVPQPAGEGKAFIPGMVAVTAANKYVPKSNVPKPAFFSGGLGQVAKRVGLGSLKGVGGLIGAVGAEAALDSTIPKFNGDSYLGQVGNELRNFGIGTASGAAGGAISGGGAGALPGAVMGAAFDVGDKVWRAGKGLNSLFNPYSEHNKYLAESKEINARLDKQHRERMTNRKPKPQVTPAIVEQQMQKVENPQSTTIPSAAAQAPVSPVVAPSITTSAPTPVIPPIAASTGSVAQATTTATLPPAASIAVAPPVTTPLPASSPVSEPSPVAPPSNNLTPKQRMDKITVDRSRAQRDKALEYAGLDPKSPPRQFSGFAPPIQQQPATTSFLPQGEPQVPQQPSTVQPTGASINQKFNVVTGPETLKKGPDGIAVGGNVFDKLKADGKVPKDFQLTKAMRTGEEALPPEIQAAKNEFLQDVKKDVTMSDSGLTPPNPYYNRKRIG